MEKLPSHLILHFKDFTAIADIIRGFVKHNLNFMKLFLQNFGVDCHFDAEILDVMVS
jgi:hypothetical protein